ncbi:tektin family protein [Sulfoacidibacillus ferrooxidans]|uniref:DUF2642 domain-containing protein n=1 Tax=Sulfoacidibacillus ferrooxidans TaxID=2005001 RepID=A0A9X1VBV1_9BACL|nr:tektin family protein [Sulfoacidibacillus ferrooxidans]MCI0184445.1 hypothetical protein [Sulfoacidibacillus ferrooxidans]
MACLITCFPSFVPSRSLVYVNMVQETTSHHHPPRKGDHPIMPHGSGHIKGKTLIVQTIQAGSLDTQHIKVRGHRVVLRYPIRKRIHTLRRELHELHKELHHIDHTLKRELHRQEEQMRDLQKELRLMKNELASGLPANPVLQAYFTAYQHQVVTVTTGGGSITGTVTLVGTNAVEITESTGDIVVIPYGKIVSIS